MDSLVVVDWVALVIMATSLVWGAWRGLVHEVLGLLGWGVAFWVAQRFGPGLAPELTFWSNDSVRMGAAFFALFLLTVMAVALVIAGLTRIMAAVGLRPVDRLLGAGFGVLRACVLLMALGVLVNATGGRDSAWWTQSVAGPLISQALQVGKTWMPAPWANYL
jgi:membrane protein required for colicin V production